MVAYGFINQVEIHQYDIVQVCHGGEWMDYSTIKTLQDAQFASKLVNGIVFGGHLKRPYRINRGFKTIVEFAG
jgi:hypothetical protein